MKNQNFLTPLQACPGKCREDGGKTFLMQKNYQHKELHLLKMQFAKKPKNPV
jgi:hypothetical protein